MAPKVGARDPVAGIAESWREKAVSRSQVTHAGHEDHEWPVAGDVIADVSFRAVQVGGGLVGGEWCRAHVVLSGSAEGIRLSQRW